VAQTSIKIVLKPKQKSYSVVEMSNLVVPPVVQSAAVSQEFGMLQALASHYLAGKTLSAPVLMSLAAALAAEVNNLKSLSGAEKKELVCGIVTQALQTALTASKVGLGSPAVAAEEEVALTYVAKNVIPASVDLLVAAANGRLSLKGVAAAGWASCLSCVPVVEKNLRGPAWDIAEKFVVAAVGSVSSSKGGSVEDVAKSALAAGVAAAEPVVAAATAAVTAAATGVPAVAATAAAVATVADVKVVVAEEVKVVPVQVTTPSS
jgi:hypothetical protein